MKTTKLTCIICKRIVTFEPPEYESIDDHDGFDVGKDGEEWVCSEKCLKVYREERELKWKPFGEHDDWEFGFKILVKDYIVDVRQPYLQRWKVRLWCEGTHIIINSAWNREDAVAMAENFMEKHNTPEKIDKYWSDNQCQ